jgi:hypothetical protein
MDLCDFLAAERTSPGLNYVNSCTPQEQTDVGEIEAGVDVRSGSIADMDGPCIGPVPDIKPRRVYVAEVPFADHLSPAFLALRMTLFQSLRALFR